VNVQTILKAALSSGVTSLQIVFLLARSVSRGSNEVWAGGAMKCEQGEQ